MIRKFAEKDSEECSKLILECIAKSTNFSEKNRKYMVKKSQPDKIIEKAKKTEFYVNEKDGRILGTGVLDKDEIRTMFVKPEMQKRGVGSEMLKFLINRAKSKGLKKVWLKSAVTADKFYEKYGFKKVGIIEEHDHRTIKMEKNV